MKTKTTPGGRAAGRTRFCIPKGMRRGILVSLAILALGSSGTFVHGRVVTPLLETTEEYEKVAAPLRKAPKKSYDFQKGSLRDILRFLADDAGISFIALPETDGENENSTLITFSITASPFTALETIARTHGTALIFEEGIFHMRPIDDKQLIARTYHIRYNTTETSPEAGSVSGGSSALGGGSSSSGSNRSSGSGDSGGGLGSTNLGMSGADVTFTTNADALVNDVMALIGIGTTGFDANVAGTASVGNFSPLMVNPDGSMTPNNGGLQLVTQPGTESAGGHVIWNSDTNTLFVVATRQQHQYVEGYLNAIDKPQPLIAVEVKFFETTKDPSRQLGIDWSGTMDGGYNFDLVNALPDGTGFIVETENPALTSIVNLDRLGSAFTAPQTAILSADAVNLNVKALLKDRETSTVSYPRVLTKNNRQVTIQSVIQQPVLAATSSTTPGVGGTSTATVEYVPIGTSIAILPKRMLDGKINLQVLITISSIIGSEIIDGNPYPIASSRVFTAPLEVENGYTLAIGGLDEAVDSEEGSGLPLLGRTPFLRKIFGHKSQSHSRKNLIMYITPTLLDTRSGGLTERPVAEVPISADRPPMPEPRVHEDGTLVGGIDGFAHAIAWLEEEHKLVDSIVNEKRGDQKTRDHISDLIRTAEILQQQAEDLKAEQPGRAEDLEQIKWTLKGVEEKFRETRWNLRKAGYHLFSNNPKTEPF